jgi:hypothetical protein
MDQLFNVSGRFLPFEQASKIMAEKREKSKNVEGEPKLEMFEEQKKEKIEIVEEEKPTQMAEFSCDVCQKICKSKAGLAVHKLRHK